MGKLRNLVHSVCSGTRSVTTFPVLFAHMHVISANLKYYVSQGHAVATIDPWGNVGWVQSSDLYVPGRPRRDLYASQAVRSIHTVRAPGAANEKEACAACACMVVSAA